MIFTNEPFHWQHESRPNEACLLLHGLGGGIYEMQWLAERLHGSGFTVRGINYPGHDKPSFRMPASAWEDWYQHITETYESMAEQYERVSIIGFSTGCPLALKLAYEHPARHQVDKLVLLSPFLNIRKGWYTRLVDPEKIIPHLSRFWPHLPRVGGLPIVDKTLVPQARKAVYYRTFNLTAVSSALELIRDIKPNLSAIENPALVVMSSQDRVVDPAGADYLMEHLGSHQKKMVWLHRSNHVIMLDADRELVLDQVTGFLQQSDPALR